MFQTHDVIVVVGCATKMVCKRKENGLSNQQKQF